MRVADAHVNTNMTHPVRRERLAQLDDARYLRRPQPARRARRSQAAILEASESSARCRRSHL